MANIDKGVCLQCKSEYETWVVLPEILCDKHYMERKVEDELKNFTYFDKKPITICGKEMAVHTQDLTR